MVHVGIAVQRCRREAQAFGAALDRRIVDRLDVDIVVLHQHVAGRLAGPGIAHHDRHDMAVAGQNRDAGLAAALAFVTALITIAVLMRLLKHMSFTPFVLYRLFLGIVLLVLYYGFDWTLAI